MQVIKRWDNEDKEITIGVCINWDTWALPLRISWWGPNIDAIENKCFNVDIDILCFRFYLEYWNWKKHV